MQTLQRTSKFRVRCLSFLFFSFYICVHSFDHQIFVGQCLSVTNHMRDWVGGGRRLEVGCPKRRDNKKHNNQAFANPTKSSIDAFELCYLQTSQYEHTKCVNIKGSVVHIRHVACKMLSAMVFDLVSTSAKTSHKKITGRRIRRGYFHAFFSSFDS